MKWYVASGDDELCAANASRTSSATWIVSRSEPTVDTLTPVSRFDRAKAVHANTHTTATNTVLQGTGDDHALDACKTLELNLAITWAPYGAPLTSNDPAAVTERKYLPSQVTLCPWFYQWAHTQELRVLHPREKIDTHKLTGHAAMDRAEGQIWPGKGCDSSGHKCLAFHSD